LALAKQHLQQQANNSSSGRQSATCWTLAAAPLCLLHSRLLAHRLQQQVQQKQVR
jgi:hypothetical protein